MTILELYKCALDYRNGRLMLNPRDWTYTGINYKIRWPHSELDNMELVKCFEEFHIMDVEHKPIVGRVLARVKYVSDN